MRSFLTPRFFLYFPFVALGVLNAASALRTEADGGTPALRGLVHAAISVLLAGMLHFETSRLADAFVLAAIAVTTFTSMNDERGACMWRNIWLVYSLGLAQSELRSSSGSLLLMAFVLSSTLSMRGIVDVTSSILHRAFLASLFACTSHVSHRVLALVLLLDVMLHLVRREDESFFLACALVVAIQTAVVTFLPGSAVAASSRDLPLHENADRACPMWRMRGGKYVCVFAIAYGIALVLFLIERESLTSHFRLSMFHVSAVVSSLMTFGAHLAEYRASKWLVGFMALLDCVSCVSHMMNADDALWILIVRMTCACCLAMSFAFVEPSSFPYALLGVDSEEGVADLRGVWRPTYFFSCFFLMVIGMRAIRTEAQISFDAILHESIHDIALLGGFAAWGIFWRSVPALWIAMVFVVCDTLACLLIFSCAPDPGLAAQTVANLGVFLSLVVALKK